jgi:hypothetical protein
MKSNAAKIISGILATISIVVIARIIVPAIWFWIGFEVVATLLVTIGCGGEWYLHHHPAGRKKVEKQEHHKIESRFIAAVAVGVFMELVFLGHAIPEAIKLENEVASANERAYTNELQVLSLRTNLAGLNKATLELAHQYDLSTNALAEAESRLVQAHSEAAELEYKLKPRTVTQAQHDEFVRFLISSNFLPSDTNTWILCSNPNDETQNFIKQVRKMLDDAGYGGRADMPFNNGLGSGTSGNGIFNCWGFSAELPVGHIVGILVPNELPASGYSSQILILRDAFRDVGFSPVFVRVPQNSFATNSVGIFIPTK